MIERNCENTMKFNRITSENSSLSLSSSESDNKIMNDSLPKMLGKLIYHFEGDPDFLNFEKKKLKNNDLIFPNPNNLHKYYSEEKVELVDSDKEKNNEIDEENQENIDNFERNFIDEEEEIIDNEKLFKMKDESNRREMALKLLDPKFISIWINYDYLYKSESYIDVFPK